MLFLLCILLFFFCSMFVCFVFIIFSTDTAPSFVFHMIHFCVVIYFWFFLVNALFGFLFFMLCFSSSLLYVSWGDYPGVLCFSLSSSTYCTFYISNFVSKISWGVCGIALISHSFVFLFRLFLCITLYYVFTQFICNSRSLTLQIHLCFSSLKLFVAFASEFWVIDWGFDLAFCQPFALCFII